MIQLEDPSDRRLASRIIEHIGSLGIDVFVHQYGLHAEGGWRIEAYKENGAERWMVEADRV